MLEIVFVLAPSYRRAYDWALEQGLQPKHWRHLVQLDQIRGRRAGTEVVVLPGAEQGATFRELRAEAERSGMNIRREVT